MNVVQWLMFMPVVQMFVGSALNICFGLASKDHIFDGSTFNVLFQNV